MNHMTTALLLSVAAFVAVPTQALAPPELTSPTLALPQDCMIDCQANVQIDALNGGQPSCKVEEDDSGFGGTHASCEFACKSFEALTIQVVAHDTHYGTAEAQGNADCADQNAPCDTKISKNDCVGVSDGTTTDNDYHGACNGNSKEFWSSPITIECHAIGRSMVCSISKDLCEGTASVSSLCASQLVGGLADLANGLEDQIPGQEWTSLVRMRITQGHVDALVIDATGESAPSCQVVSL